MDYVVSQIRRIKINWIIALTFCMKLLWSNKCKNVFKVMIWKKQLILTRKNCICMSENLSVYDGKYTDNLDQAGIWITSIGGRFKLLYFISHKPVMANFLRLVSVLRTCEAPMGWPQLIRAVIDWWTQGDNLTILNYFST